MAGLVLVDEQKVTKAGALVPPEAPIRILGNDCPWVSRGGLKLEGALEAFHLDVTGRECLDVGASTGGFTDVLLTRGATRVHAVDVGHNQLHWKIRSDSRVRVLEGYNARSLDPADFAGARFGAVVMDLSFISLRLVLPSLYALLEALGAGPADVIALVKPQFEAGRAEVGKGGIVRDPEVRERVLREVCAAAGEAGFAVAGHIPSPITGADGNVEYLLHLVFPGGGTGGEA